MFTLWAQHRETAEQATKTNYVPDIMLDSRFSYERQTSGHSAGFGGDGIILNICGDTGRHLSYAFSYFLHAVNGDDTSVFDATDWLTLTYDINNFALTAGKHDLLIGSWEHDTYDLDNYTDITSFFTQRVNSSQWGIKAEWSNKLDNTTLALQVSNSPFSYAPKQANLYSYAVAWLGSFSHYESFWTLNMWEFAPGNFLKSIAIGNKFNIGNISLTLDYMMRGTKLNQITEDITLTALPSYTLGEKVRLFGKIGWEKCSDNLTYDFLGEYTSLSDKIEANSINIYTIPAYIIGEKDYLFYGAGIEYYPLRDNKNVRLHAVWASNNYTSRHTINVGITWRLDIMRIIRKIANPKY